MTSAQDCQTCAVSSQSQRQDRTYLPGARVAGMITRSETMPRVQSPLHQPCSHSCVSVSGEIGNVSFVDNNILKCDLIHCPTIWIYPVCLMSVVVRRVELGRHVGGVPPVPALVQVRTGGGKVGTVILSGAPGRSLLPTVGVAFACHEDL